MVFSFELVASFIISRAKVCRVLILFIAPVKKLCCNVEIYLLKTRLFESKAVGTFDVHTIIFEQKLKGAAT